MKTGWCIDGDHGLYYGHPHNEELHEKCRHGETVRSRSIDCDCWCHTEATKPPKKRASKTVKRNGRTAKKEKAVVDKSMAGKKGYSKNGKKLGRPKGSKNRVKVKSV